MTPLPVNLRYLEGTDNRRLDMVVVIPVARCEWHLAIKLLKWMRTFKDESLCDTIVLCAPRLNEPEMIALREAAGNVVDVHQAKFVDTGYFGGANNMMKSALEYVEKKHPGKAMLYVETDAIPMRAGWFDAILDEYRGCGQPFMGDVHLCEINHVTGNGCYHPNWRAISPMLAALPGPDPEWGWDTQCADDTFTRCHRAKTIQQIWRPPLPITAEWARKNIRPETALFHQVKDGSLIDVLCDASGIERIPLPEKLEESTYAKGRITPPSERELGRLKTPGARMIAGIPSIASAPVTEILYVTCAKDMEFLRYSLKSVEKFASGFAGITIVAPERERGQYDWVKKAKVKYFAEAPEKGFLHHLVQKCRADEWCPHASAILHLDPDCIFWAPATPADFFVGGKPKLLRERYADLRNPNRKFWQIGVEKALGFKPEYECMVAHPQVHLRDVYAKTRVLVELNTKMDFDSYVLSGQNDFPQSYCEYDCLGAVAISRFRSSYECIDYNWALDAAECGLPKDTNFQYIYRRGRDLIVECWSHGGIDRYRSDIESWLAGKIPQYWLK